MNWGSALRALQAGLVVAAGVITANAESISSPYNWIASGAIAVVTAVVSELVAGMSARATINELMTRASASGRRATANSEPFKLTSTTPWWYWIIRSR